MKCLGKGFIIGSIFLGIASSFATAQDNTFIDERSYYKSKNHKHSNNKDDGDSAYSISNSVKGNASYGNSEYEKSSSKASKNWSYTQQDSLNQDKNKSMGAMQDTASDYARSDQSLNKDKQSNNGSYHRKNQSRPDTMGMGGYE